MADRSTTLNPGGQRIHAVARRHRMKCVYLDCTEFGRSVLTPAVLDKVPDLVLHIGDPVTAQRLQALAKKGSKK